MKAEDGFIIAEEGASSLGDCYVTNYHLSDSYVLQMHPNLTDIPYFHGYHADSKYPMFFHGNTLVNWAIFSAPRHKLFEHVLRNIVEIITSDYLRKNLVMMTKWDVKWKQVMCSTNFVVTYTLRELLIEGLEPEYMPRVCRHDYAEYKGKAKAIWTGGDPTHYMKVSCLPRYVVHILLF